MRKTATKANVVIASTLMRFIGEQIIGLGVIMVAEVSLSLLFFGYLQLIGHSLFRGRGPCTNGRLSAKSFFSAKTDGSRDALCPLKSCLLLHET